MQTTLYDKTGMPVAYIDSIEQNTIYLWNGNPVCYLYQNKIYGFNGLHLGWYENGIVRDLFGCRIGFTPNTCPVLTKISPIKSLKRLKPVKSLKQLPRIKPLYKSTLSEDYLMPYLSNGVK